MRLISVSVTACCPAEKGLRARALADPKQQQLQQWLWQSALLQQVETVEGQAEWLQVLQGHLQAAAVLCVPKRSGTDRAVRLCEAVPQQRQTGLSSAVAWLMCKSR